MKKDGLNEIVLYPESNLHLQLPPNHIQQVATVAQGRYQHPGQFAVYTSSAAKLSSNCVAVRMR
jgi:hypothetical protein